MHPSTPPYRDRRPGAPTGHTRPTGHPQPTGHPEPTEHPRPTGRPRPPTPPTPPTRPARRARPGPRAVPDAAGHRHRRIGRLCRRVLFPPLAGAVLLGLALTAYAGLAGAPAGNPPYAWRGGAVYLAGGAGGDGTYTTCTVRPGHGDVRAVPVPAGGLELVPWFAGSASITCARSVSVTAGPQLALYPYALDRTVLLILTVLAAATGFTGFRLRERHPARFRERLRERHPARLREKITPPRRRPPRAPR